MIIGSIPLNALRNDHGFLDQHQKKIRIGLNVLERHAVMQTDAQFEGPRFQHADGRE
jgi:hypothetical protein